MHRVEAPAHATEVRPGHARRQRRRRPLSGALVVNGEYSRSCDPRIPFPLSPVAMQVRTPRPGQKAPSSVDVDDG